MTTEEKRVQVFLETLDKLHPQALTLDQLCGVLAATSLMAVRWKREIERRTKAEAQRKSQGCQWWSA